MNDPIVNIQDIFTDFFPDYNLTENFCNYTIKEFLRALPATVVQDAMITACSKMKGADQAISYFCGICWRKIKTGQQIEPIAAKKKPIVKIPVNPYVVRHIIEITSLSFQDRRNLIAIYCLSCLSGGRVACDWAMRFLKIPKPKIGMLRRQLDAVIAITAKEDRL